MARSIFELEPIGRNLGWLRAEPSDDDVFVFNINRFQSPSGFNDEAPPFTGGGLAGTQADDPPPVETGEGGGGLSPWLDLPIGDGGPEFPYNSLTELIWIILGLSPPATETEDTGPTDRGLFGGI